MAYFHNQQRLQYYPLLQPPLRLIQFFEVASGVLFLERPCPFYFGILSYSGGGSSSSIRGRSFGLGGGASGRNSSIATIRRTATALLATVTATVTNITLPPKKLTRGGIPIDFIVRKDQPAHTNPNKSWLSHLNCRYCHS